MKRFLPFVIIIAVLGVALTLGSYLWHSAENETAASPAVSPSAPAMPSMMGAQPPHLRGPENASVILEEFGDFECPACAKFYPIWKSLEGEYGKRVQVTFRHFPLAMQHKRALRAAYAAEAAGLQSKFWEMHDKLYENHETWSKATEATELESIFSTYAQELKLDLDRFKQDQTSDLVKNRVNQDFQRGRSLRIKATPTLFLNGAEVPYRELKTIQEFRRVLDDALKQK